ncbi:1-deoxy-D-xylulose-5-phosphate synthase [Nitrosococcus oceani ATCC 19707]|uniref:1-deoxy-D-xylulose-5-phosphate synthase n=2 Tax=Nitrosococcus oceani TaxID=1229 RepID=DXS_NITOC|nr:1-deoxy-D-xylulose-5-phosphate synthase [Nitrosococcus oceani]Q3JAD1.1 RecName: Full=1-deoxy-D-xylulose-5-phosphate synthase; AltName: Full=1-deoxyxylulose-5-phosphate synthase; Short=DXP synthase; Short=DXPS [Nitrosococcus oceani ATCC 19707]KFI19328.1 1-deoxy-D-xylulose-5-phosphate synthase [Nitrosococcus oceani C-27]ABA58215.1 1-deoxy-D-xylulose-5-phosphate synthase [Nitrosococcus oceani ATCC 19707]EDZ68229.1 1-deoxy-D-xylulose-5-phosphate synthase [Nitrosococcus oceani AFC27]GEM20435.1 1
MASVTSYPLLEQIDSPERLRRLPESDLETLAEELRDFLLHSVARSGGHLAAGLGTIELTIALHYIFATPEDRLVWDVGHQAYPHKVLTGRRERLGTIRQAGGLAPFPSRHESPYDTFGVGHSSTSISAALGMAIAANEKGEKRKTVAIIGDGGMTAGMAYEALDHAGALGADLLVILNDNEMSISPNVGAISSYLTRLLSGRVYSTVREGSKKVLERMPPPMWELARRTEEHVKGMVAPGTLFEEMGFNYFGPIDGHDLSSLIRTLRNLHKLTGPRLLHIVTCKGKGYTLAEENPVTYHGVTPFDPKVGIQQGPQKPSSAMSYTQVFSQWLCDMAAQDGLLVGITPAMREGSGLVKFSECFPERYFDVAIAEQHSVTLAAGMACDGLKPVVAIYSTFLQRAYDQLIHDVALQNLPVLFAIDRAGVVGPDGPTHAGSFDLTYLRCIPNLVVMAPADENECRQMLYTGFLLNQPAAVRYPRGKGPGVAVEASMTALPLGKAELKRKGRGIAILAFGATVAPALEAAEKLDATVVNMRFVKPLDEDLVLEMAMNHELLVTVEDNVIAGGAGSAVSECLAYHGVSVPLLLHGLPDNFLEHGSREALLEQCHLNAEGILQRVKTYRARLPKSKASVVSSAAGTHG